MFSASLYQPIYLIFITILTFFASSNLKKQSARQLIYADIGLSPIYAIVISALLAFFLGTRPQTYDFGDTGNYVFVFENLKRGNIIGHPEEEWVWFEFLKFCADVSDTQVFLILDDLLYIGFTLIACYIIVPRHGFYVFLFNLAALSFFSYGTNGIRNGLACSIMLSAISCATFFDYKKLLAIGVAYIAYNTHHSTLLPFGMMIISMYFIKSFKWAYTFWILSIVLSLLLGNSIASIFASLGFDERLSYLTVNANSSMFRHTGFRFDFLIYSMMPIILGYYIIIKKGIKNRTYELLLNTYTLTNAFWVMVIRANFSNRFAYLSWFMYPVVLAYPLFKMNVWGELQGRRASQIMLAQLGFTLFMDLLYW